MSAEECEDLSEDPLKFGKLSSSNPLDTISQTVIHLVDDNILHFHEDESEQGQRLYSGLRALRDGLFRVSDVGEIIRKEAPNYDFSPEVPGNGFRSFSNMIQQAFICVLELCKNISANRDSILLFRKAHYVREVEAWGQTVASLSTLLDYIASTLLPLCKDGNLMPDMDSSTTQLMSLLNTVSQYSFYGRCLGFHYYESLHKTLKFLNISMCAFSEVYYSDGGFMKRTKQSLFTSGKYLMNPEQRARRIVDVVQYSSVDFIKSFWSLADTEFLAQLPGIVGPNLNVNQLIVVPCEDSTVETLDKRLTMIPAPQSHIPPTPIQCFLLSNVMREGMPGETQHKGSVFPPSDKIIFHCHGGGFVTQSTKAQEVFLREWAVSLGVPLFSVDYSLAPEARYPRPLEEVLTAYVWMLNNFKLLGTSGSRIVCTGDSAGGNLITALTIRCLELRLRPPDALFLIYTPFSVKIQPTPARLLAVTDPMLPLGFALRCLKAYAGLPSNRTSEVNSPSNLPSSFTSRSSSESTPEHSEKTPPPDVSQNTLDVMDKATSPSKSQSSKSSRKKKDKSIPKDCVDNPALGSRDELKSTKGVETSLKEDKLVDPLDTTKGEKVSDTESFVEVTEDDVIEAKMASSKSFNSEPETDTMTTVSLTSDPSSVKLDHHRKEDLDSEAMKDRSKKYVSEFLEKYVLDSKIDSQGRKVPILRTGSEDIEEENILYDAPSSGSGITAKLGKAKEAVIDGLTARWSSLKLKGKGDATPSPPDSSPSKDISPTEIQVKRKPSIGRIPLGTSKLRRDSSCSLLEEFMGVEVFNDHYISPLTAPKQLLAQFPQTSIMTVEYDFCLDDCVTMASLLRSLSVPVTLDVLDRLPHGFLNLSLVSKEAHDGCKLSVTRLRNLLGIEEEEASKGTA